MFRVLELVLFGAFVLYAFVLIYRKWQQLDLEEKAHAIKETEEKYTKVKSLKKDHPDYDKKKKEVEEFEGKK